MTIYADGMFEPYEIDRIYQDHCDRAQKRVNRTGRHQNKMRIVIQSLEHLLQELKVQKLDDKVHDLETFIQAQRQKHNVTEKFSKRAGEGLFIQDNPGTFLIFSEKHGERYFDTSTPDLTAAAVLKIARERYDEGWYDTAEDLEPRDQPDLFREEKPTEKMIFAKYLKIAEETPRLNCYAARTLLSRMMMRTDYEYEGVEYGLFESVE